MAADLAAWHAQQRTETDEVVGTGVSRMLHALKDTATTGQDQAMPIGGLLPVPERGEQEPQTPDSKPPPRVENARRVEPGMLREPGMLTPVYPIPSDTTTGDEEAVHHRPQHRKRRKGGKRSGSLGEGRAGRRIGGLRETETGQTPKGPKGQ